jgi:hypothetical protein
MMKKGISTIIASIILVVITIGLLATAYLFFTGMVAVGPVVSLESGRCTYDEPTNEHNVTIVLRNKGTSDWDTGDLTFRWDGEEVDPVDTECLSVPAGETKKCVFTNGTPSTNAMPSDITGTHNLAIYGPNTIPPSPIDC